MAKKQAVQPRLDDDVGEMVNKAAAKNGRTVPREVNYVLRQYYSAVPLDLSAIPPTYWTDAQRAEYQKTGVWPGTNGKLVHSPEQVQRTLYGDALLRTVTVAKEKPKKVSCRSGYKAFVKAMKSGLNERPTQKAMKSK